MPKLVNKPSSAALVHCSHSSGGYPSVSSMACHHASSPDLSMSSGVICAGCSSLMPKVLAPAASSRTCTPTWSVPANTIASASQIGVRKLAITRSRLCPYFCVAVPRSRNLAWLRSQWWSASLSSIFQFPPYDPWHACYSARYACH